MVRRYRRSALQADFDKLEIQIRKVDADKDLICMHESAIEGIY